MTHRIPEFPHFKHLDLGDQNEIERFARHFPPYSDFNFVSLYVHDIADDCHVSRLNDNLIVRFRDDITQEPFYSFLGCTQVTDTATRLLSLADEEGLPSQLRLIPEACINGDPDSIRQTFDISEDPDSADYIIEVASMVSLATGGWRSKRKAANKFKRNNPHHSIAQINLEDADIQASITRLFHAWREKRGKTAEVALNELEAISRLLRHCRHFRLFSLGAFVDGQLEGFTVNEVVHDGHYMGHFGKTNPDRRGLAVVLESETAKYMQALGCTYMNYQQDMGLDGLKRHKASWHPIAHLRKYIIGIAAETQGPSFGEAHAREQLRDR